MNFLSLDPKRSNFHLTAAERGRDEQLRLTLLQTITAAVWDFSQGKDAEMKFKDRVLNCSTFHITEHQIKFHLQHICTCSDLRVWFIYAAAFTPHSHWGKQRPETTTKVTATVCNRAISQNQTESESGCREIPHQPAFIQEHNQLVTSQQPAGNQMSWVSYCKESHHHRLTPIHCNVLPIYL